MRPITAQPGYTEADTENLLATGQFVLAECFTLTLYNGDSYYYTTWQQDVTVVEVGGVERRTYKAGSVLISGLRFKISIGIEVDEQDVNLSWGPNDTIQGLSYPNAMKWGRLDGAVIKRDRFFAANGRSPWIGGCPMFAGKVSTIDSVGRSEAKLKVKSAMVYTNINMPRELYQPSCRNVLGDTRCGVDLDALAVHVVIAGTVSDLFLPWTSANQGYAGGFIHIENGDSVTRIRTIREVEDGVGLHLVYPLDFTPVIGDQFVVYPACNRTTTRCQDFWGPTDWVHHFNGFPFVPVAETAA